jgi:DNA polymerase III delta prime subunit
MLEHELRDDRLPQTLLFYGPEGVGKFLTALELVKVLNCSGDGGPEGCGCPGCRAVQNLVSRDLLIIAKSNFLNTFRLWKRYGVNRGNLHHFIRDLRRASLSTAGEQQPGLAREREALLEKTRDENGILEAAREIIDAVLRFAEHLEGSVIGINQIREMQRFLSLKSEGGGCRSVILDGAESMNAEASNSFLKVSEDTPPNTIIILVTANRDGIRETIRSRSRSYRFVPLSRESWNRIIGLRFGDGAEPTAPTENPAAALFWRMVAEREDLLSVLETIGETVDGALGTQFLDCCVETLRGAIPTLQGDSMEEVQEVEGLLRKIDAMRTSIVRHHADARTALTDLVLNNLGSIARYAS